MRVVVLAIVLTLTAAAVAPTAAASSETSAVTYRAPADAAVVDGFRPPPKPWMAGNLGIDLGTAPGDIVRAPADGRVLFAGQVAGALHVTIEHADGLRTTCSFLATVSVSAGERVRLGDPIGTTDGPMHFGVRTPDDTYLDPAALLDGSLHPTSLLIPGADEGIEALGAHERRTLLRTLLDTGVAATAFLARTGAEATALLVHEADSLLPAAILARSAMAFERWNRQRSRCTAASQPVPPPTQRRIVILVSGLGTASDSNSAWEFDTGALGYRAGDVVRFSYRGGRAPTDGDGDTEAGPRAIAGTAPVRPFTSIDSQQPIGVSADRLAALVDSVAAAHPGVPIDVLAHSQGGLVARLGLERAAATDHLPAAVSTLVTVGSPHEGAPLASGIDLLRRSPAGAEALGSLRGTGALGPLDERSPAVADLSEFSPVIEELHRRDLPEHVRFVSLGGSGDLVVPGTVSQDDVADDQRILPTAVGTAAHGELPSDPRVTREIGLAVAGLGLTCQSWKDALGAFLTAESVRAGETAGLLSAAVSAGTVPGVVAPGVGTGLAGAILPTWPPITFDH